MGRSVALRLLLGALVATVVLAQLLPGTSSSFTATTDNSGNSVSAAADWTGPAVSAVELQKSQGGVVDKLKQGGSATSATASVDNTAFAAGSFLTTNVTTAGKAVAGDKVTFTYNHAPDPESLFAGWDGSSRTVTVVLVDGGVYGMSSSTQDLFGVLDSGGSMSSLGYVVTGGDYVASNKQVTYCGSTVALSGSTSTVTLGPPDVSGNLKTDSTANAAQWVSTATAFDGFANLSSGSTVTGVSRVQF